MRLCSSSMFCEALGLEHAQQDTRESSLPSHFPEEFVFKMEMLFLHGQESILGHFQPAPRKEQQSQNTHPFAKYSALTFPPPSPSSPLNGLSDLQLYVLLDKVFK